MSESTILSALFFWAVALVSAFAAVRVAAHKMRANWSVGVAFLIAMALAGSASGITSTYYILTGQMAVDTPVGSLAILLRAAAAAMLLGIVLYYAIPRSFQARIEKRLGLSER